MDDLWKRFEAPNDSNRWDNPLFRVKNTSQAVQFIAETAIPDNTTAVVDSVIQPKSLKSSWKPKKKKDDIDASVSTDDSSINLPQSSTSNTLSISGSTVTYSDDLAKFVELSEVFNPMTDYLLHANLPLPNSSTIVASHAQADLLYELDRTSQRIIQLIITHQADALEGTPLKFSEFDRVLTLNRHISPGELHRYRSQFVKLNSQHPPITSMDVGILFIEFLALQL
jgi:tRNA uridine 5-carbamoylmethylation protein Kti12